VRSLFIASFVLAVAVTRPPIHPQLNSIVRRVTFACTAGCASPRRWQRDATRSKCRVSASRSAFARSAPRHAYGDPVPVRGQQDLTSQAARSFRVALYGLILQQGPGTIASRIRDEAVDRFSARATSSCSTRIAHAGQELDQRREDPIASYRYIGCSAVTANALVRSVGARSETRSTRRSRQRRASRGHERIGRPIRSKQRDRGEPRTVIGNTARAKRRCTSGDGAGPRVHRISSCHSSRRRLATGKIVTASVLDLGAPTILTDLDVTVRRVRVGTPNEDRPVTSISNTTDDFERRRVARMVIGSENRKSLAIVESTALAPLSISQIALEVPLARRHEPRDSEVVAPRRVGMVDISRSTSIVRLRRRDDQRARARSDEANECDTQAHPAILLITDKNRHS